MTIHLVTEPSRYEVDDIELVRVSEALRRNDGIMRIRGMIISLSKLFKMISGTKFYCDKCRKLIETTFPSPVFNIRNDDRKCSICASLVSEVNCDYVNAVLVELQDLESFNDLDRLSVFLFDKHTENIRVGEIVMIKGKVLIENHKDGKKLFPYFYCQSILYERDNKITLTQMDIEAVKGFTIRKNPKIIDQLVSMFDPSIIGYEFVKKGLLLCAVNSSSDLNLTNAGTRERIHGLLIGEAGLAKTKLLRAITKLVPNSRYESGQNSSGKSLTAIVSKEEDNYVLRLGPASLAKNAICGINEFGRTSFGDQTHFLDIMEEGEFTINKHGINATIKAPSTIIGSANPIHNSTWIDENKIDMNEIPALKPIIDRFDLVFVFRNSKDPKILREYAYKKSEFESNKVPDYSRYLVIHMEYAKTLRPKVSDEAKIMLNEYFVEIKTNGENFGSNRILDTLFRLSKAFARLKLKDIVDEVDAKDVIEFYNVILEKYQQVVNVQSNPRDLTYDEGIKLLKEVKIGVTLEELFTRLTQKYEYIKRYLCFGNKPLRLRDNIKVRFVYDMFLNHPNVRKIQEKPVVLQWFDSICDVCDPNDPAKSISQITNELNIPETHGKESHTSYQSLGSDTKLENMNVENFAFECYYCKYSTESKLEYESHVIKKHKGRLCYPNKASLNNMSLKEKGKDWE